MGVEIFLGNSLQSLDPQEDFYMVNLSSTFLSNCFELAMGQQSRVKNILKCFSFVILRLRMSWKLIFVTCLHYIETSQLICTANQLTGFYMMRTLVLNG